MPRWNMPRRSCHVSVGVGIVYLKLMINVLCYMMISATKAEVNMTKKRKSRRTRAREEKRGDTA